MMTADLSHEDLYEHAPCGYLSTDGSGLVVQINQTLLDWIGHGREAIVGKSRFQDLLAVGDRLFLETHLTPLLAVEGAVREIAVEVRRADGSRLPVLFNAVRREVETPEGRTEVIRFTLFDATERRRYERELLDARRRAEEALARVRSLEGLLPICAWCHRIRDDAGSWLPLEAYLQEAGASVTHSICQSCADAHG